ncbi:MAG: hypothetical protein EOO74_00670 [Myxococcales bacterium]|nr:MAG: hypothetical protein EOO74_00670 [Myxococcales bacterium]
MEDLTQPLTKPFALFAPAGAPRELIDRPVMEALVRLARAGGLRLDATRVLVLDRSAFSARLLAHIMAYPCVAESSSDGERLLLVVDHIAALDVFERLLPATNPDTDTRWDEALCMIAVGDPPPDNTLVVIHLSQPEGATSVRRAWGYVPISGEPNAPCLGLFQPMGKP